MADTQTLPKYELVEQDYGSDASRVTQARCPVCRARSEWEPDFTVIEGWMIGHTEALGHAEAP